MGKIYVTGVGILTNIGDSLDSNRKGLIAGKCGIGKLEYFDTKYAESKPFGEIKLSNDKLKEILNVEDESVSRTTLLALHAINQVIIDANLSEEEITSQDTALVIGNTVGGMCLTDELYNDANHKTSDSPYLASYDCASISIFLQKKYGFKGVVSTINTACSSAANAIMHGSRLIKHGLAKRAIVGGVDSLAKFTINGFNSLHILSDELCSPFDENRQGLNLGEGAAFLVLEGEETANKKKYVEVKGYSNANDAFHPSTLSENGDGPYLAMQQALKEANLQPADIQFINTHGTATENNDEVESRAMSRLFKEGVPAFASTKSNIGHTLGASGAIEAVYCILNIMHQEIYPSINFKVPIASTQLIPQTIYRKTPINHVMSNAFGFGGNCSSLIFSKI